MNLSTLMKDNYIDLFNTASSKDEVFQTVAKKLKDDQRIDNVSLFIKDLYLREEMESTNLIPGIALPHSKSESILQSSVSLLRSTEGIDWEDGKDKVHIVFLLAVSPHDKDVTHLETIASIATLLMEDEFKDLLYNAKNNEEIIHYIESN